MINQEQTIKSLVEKLPEVYQPIFKHPEFTAQASRSCLDRLEKIASVYDYISEEKGRPLKVLDLGCAQGFFSLNLAERGAIVTAVDYSQPNVDVCNKLASENKNFNVNFMLGSIENVINDNVEEGEFDLVLGLSVFHHLIYEHGAEFVFDLFRKLSSKIETGIFEFALNSEPLYWAESQPENPRDLIDSFSFSHYLSMYGTHLSSVERPLFFASNKYWHIENMYGIIDSYMQRSHQLDNFYHGNNRRYFFSENKTIKIFLDNASDTNHTELLNESIFLEKSVEGFRTAKLISYGSFGHESWMVRTTIPGRLLLDILINNESYDDEEIISGVLEQVCVLEENGLYHNDLRPWNILIGDDGLVYIIDYGSISPQLIDGDDLYGQLLSFFVLIKEISQHRIREQGSQRPPYISPYDFPEKYQNWLSQVWSLPSQKWSFRTIQKFFNEVSDAPVDIPFSAMLESHLSTTVNYLTWQFTQLQNKFSLNMEEIKSNMDDLNKKVDEDVCLKFIQLKEIIEAESKGLERDSQEQFYGITVKIESMFNDLKVHQEHHNLLTNDKIDAILSKVENYSVAQCNGHNAGEQDQHFVSKQLSEDRRIADELRRELDSVYNCKSWKITYPLRIMSKSVKLLFKPRVVLNRIKSSLKKKSSGLVPRLKVFVENRPLLKQRAMIFLNKNPALKYKIKKRMRVNSATNVLVTPINNIDEPEVHIAQSEHNYAYTPLKSGVNEKQKSVLESWLN